MLKTEDDFAAPPAKPEDPLIGTLLQGKYRVVRMIGQGGMGRVYEGEHTLIGRRVAIKTLLGRYAKDADVVSRFRREAQAATSIGHEHIIEVTDLGDLPDGGIFLVLELLDGCNLGELIAREGPLPIGRVMHIVSQMCDALNAAHARGIVHRDLKPENVFLIRRGDDPDFVKLVDFGISKIRSAEDAVSLTKTGVPVGTPLYMAPEQARGQRDVDHRIDIYALGVILFAALTSRLPFEDESYAALLVKILADPPPDVRTFRADVPDALARVINRLLEKERNDRPSSCVEVRALLAPFSQLNEPASVAAPPASAPIRATTQPYAAPPAAYAGATYSAASAGADSVVELPTRSRAVLVAIAGALGLTVAAGIGVAAWSAGHEEREVSPAAAAPAIAPAPGPAVPDPPPEVEAPADVRVRIAIEPSDAELTLNGLRVDNPFERTLAPLSTPQELVARLEGYETENRELRFDRSVDVTIALTPLRAAPASPAPRPAPPRPVVQPVAQPVVRPMEPAPVVRAAPPPPPERPASIIPTAPAIRDPF